MWFSRCGELRCLKSPSAQSAWCTFYFTSDDYFLLNFPSLDMTYGMLLFIITWLLCFSRGFDRFIPGFDRFIPASIPVIGTLPLQSKCTLVNKICIVLYCEIILFNFLMKIVFHLKKNIFQIWDQNIFAEKIKLTPIQCCPCLISMPQAVDCDPQAITGVSQVL